jgi:hypothetical protein
VAIILLELEVGARAGEVASMTVCYWNQREDGSVFVSINLAKNGKNGEVAGAVLVPGQGVFADDQFHFRGILLSIPGFTRFGCELSLCGC